MKKAEERQLEEKPKIVDGGVMGDLEDALENEYSSSEDSDSNSDSDDGWSD